MLTEPVCSQSDRGWQQRPREPWETDIHPCFDYSQTRLTNLKRPGMGGEHRITCMGADRDRLLAGSEKSATLLCPTTTQTTWTKISPPASSLCKTTCRKICCLNSASDVALNHAGGCFPKVTKIILFAAQRCSVAFAESLVSSLKISGAGHC